MEPTSSSRHDDTSGAVPVERRPILLRGYAEADPLPESKGRQWRQGPAPFALFFDTETTDGAAQRLRFGCYQTWQGERRAVSGIFYDPDNVKPKELGALQHAAASRGHRLMTAAEFIEAVFYPMAQAGALIVGFNLPFDISRLAINHNTARAVRRKDGSMDRSMQGGFSFTLSSDPKKGHVRVKHLSRRASFMNFTRPSAERGFFLDIKTLAAALTSQSHTLDSLAKALKTRTRKAAFTDYGRDIDEEFISYAIDDVQVTRECYELLVEEYKKHGLSDQTPATRIYSEASLGKAYLEAMNVRSWWQMQHDFPNDILGAIMCSYFGGRAEVHRRREVVRTIYCDFASMYPTVCTLQQLWRFVIANGVDWAEATAETKAFLEKCDLASLQDPTTWRRLPTLVKVVPDGDIFPVRAKYGREAVATIGLNQLSSDRGLWFTLADCVASKLLTGKSPTIEKAFLFEPREIQPDLGSINIAGNSDYRIDPTQDDFYKRLIDLRRSVKVVAGNAISQEEKDALNSEQLALKILANATSYGIFIEINVEDEDEKNPRTIHTGDSPFPASSDKLEVPGAFFHPLLATLITGAARLMLAITERLAIIHGLDWAFCDTDSMAFAMPPGTEREMSEDGFRDAVQEVCAWFEPLNPYDQPGSILELEDQNFGVSDKSEEPPLYCYAVSAKRYALFNIDRDGDPVIRKASAHGLGHLYPPYGTEDPDGPERDSGVLRWQEDVWRDIVGAALKGESQPLPFGARPELMRPAASRYSATTPHIISWFKHYNESRPYQEQIRPFGFLTWFHAKRTEERFFEEVPETAVWDPRARAPKPVAAYDRDISRAADDAFDREPPWEPVPLAWLRTYAEALRQYHIHPETKFLGGGHMQTGPLMRRHVFASAVEYIGKEADNWEEDSHFGADEDSAIGYGVAPKDRARMVDAIRHAVRVEKVGVKRLSKLAGVTDHAVTRLVNGETALAGDDIVKMYRAAEELLAGKRAQDDSVAELLEWARAQPRHWLAPQLGYDLSNLRKVLTGQIRPKHVLKRMFELKNSGTASQSAT
jgi:hypothetical protein